MLKSWLLLNKTTKHTGFPQAQVCVCARTHPHAWAHMCKGLLFSLSWQISRWQILLIYLEMWFHSSVLWGLRTLLTMSLGHYTVISEKLHARLVLRILLMIKGTEYLYIYEPWWRPVPPSHTREVHHPARGQEQKAGSSSINLKLPEYLKGRTIHNRIFLW